MKVTFHYNTPDPVTIDVELPDANDPEVAIDGPEDLDEYLRGHAPNPGHAVAFWMEAR